MLSLVGATIAVSIALGALSVIAWVLSKRAKMLSSNDDDIGRGKLFGTIRWDCEVLRLPIGRFG